VPGLDEPEFRVRQAPREFATLLWGLVSSSKTAGEHMVPGSATSTLCRHGTTLADRPF
jgi:hypothetical protein